MDDSGIRRLSEPPRFVLSDEVSSAGTAKVAGADLHHMRHVLRLLPGAPVVLVDGLGTEYHGQIKEFHREFALIEVLGKRQRARLAQTTLGVAMIKGWRMDFLVEKAAELGASDLWPLRCARSVVREAGAERVQRWRRLASAAAKQSLSPFIMEIRPACLFAEFLERTQGADFAAICHQGAPPLGLLARQRAFATAVVVCGPEGDFTAQELESATRAGFVEAGLGPHRLRTETAALAALSVLADASATAIVSGGKP
jgi:16S rRNA (uracil1498-N3)-methyltransferase